MNAAFPSAAPPATRPLRLGWGLLILLAGFGLFDHSLWSSNDAREGAMIREMTRDNVWVAPCFNGRPYLEKPPLLHWTGRAVCILAGRVNEGLVRLPAALFGIGTLLIVGRWAGRLGRARAGLTAALLCATSLLYLEYTRIVLTDAALMFMVTLALYLFWRAASRGRLAGAGGLLFLTAAGLSFYAKGLVGPGLVWLPVAGYLAWRRQWRRLAGLALAFVPIFALLLAPWVLALWRAGGPAYLYGVFWENQVGRFFTFHDPSLPLDPYFVHKEPAWFYLQALPVRLLPWTLLVIPALAWWFRPGNRAAGEAGVFLRWMLVGMLALLHLSSSKAACYALPMFPALFLMTALWIEDTARAGVPGWGGRLAVATFWGVGLAVLLVPLVYLGAWVAGLELLEAPGRAAELAGVGLALLALGLAAAGILWWVRRGRRAPRDDLWMAAPAALAAVGLVGAAAFLPAIDYQRTYEPLARSVQREWDGGRRMAFAGRHERELGALMFYLDARFPVVSVTNDVEVQAFVEGAPGPAGLVVPDRALARVRRLIAGGRYRLAPIPHAGKKSGEFRLLLRDR